MTKKKSALTDASAEARSERQPIKPQQVELMVKIGTENVVLTCTLVGHPFGPQYGTMWLPDWHTRAIEDAVCRECKAAVKWESEL